MSRIRIDELIAELCPKGVEFKASARAQVPLLKRALRSMRNEQFEISDDIEIAARRFIGIILQATIVAKNAENLSGNSLT